MGERSREYFAVWLAGHKPNFVVAHTQESTHFFRFPSFINLKRVGKGYVFSLKSDGFSFKMELEEGFNAFCMDKYLENSVSLVDSKCSVEIIEEYDKGK